MRRQTFVAALTTSALSACGGSIQTVPLSGAGLAIETVLPAFPFPGEMRTWSGTKVPTGWLPANGALLSVATYPQLFLVFGGVFGGDGKTTFALPKVKRGMQLVATQGRSFS